MQIEISNEGLIYLTDSVILSIIRCCCGLRNDIHSINSNICEDIYLCPKDEISELLNKSKNYIKLKFYIQNFDHILPKNNFVENYFINRKDKDGVGHWSRHSNNFYNIINIARDELKPIIREQKINNLYESITS